MNLVVGGLLGLGVLVAWMRLARWWVRSPARSRGWRLALLLAGQPAVAVLLYLTLFPPPAPLRAAATLTVLTHGARWTGASAIALPEAGAAIGAEPAPDLATALRRHPGTRRLRVIGEGLEARDVGAAQSLTIAFDPPPPPMGIVSLAPPREAVAPGAGFLVGGEAAGVAGGSAALLDPAGVEGQRMPLDRDGGFVLAGAAHVPGVALFRVRLRDARGRIVEEADVPVRTAPPTPVRVLYLAGTAAPETKYWRRWAADAGLAVTLRVVLGAGLELGDPPPPLSAAALSRFDLAIVDERSWANLSGADRAAIAAAVRGGLGLLLRVTGPLPPAVRESWAGFGIPLLDATGTMPMRLPGDTRQALPLTRRVALVPGPAMVPLLRDASGGVPVAWRAVSLGRVGVWTLADASSLVTSGSAPRFGELWGTTVAALARAVPGAAPAIGARPTAGERVTICTAGPVVRVASPNDASGFGLGGGTGVELRPDPVAGSACAGYWPWRAGWHVLLQGTARTPFYVYPADALPAARAQDRRDRTLATIGAAGLSRATGGATRPGAAWPWLALFLAVAGALWRFERVTASRS